jgi:hypothetical protein
MIATRFPLLVVALLGAALVAGCGSSSTSSSTTASTPVTTSTSSPAAAATTSTTPATTSPATTSLSAAGVAQYVAICKSVIQREPTLAASVKAKVEGICNKAAGGDIAGARAAAKEVCVEVINASPIPAAAKEHALAACKTS